MTFPPSTEIRKIWNVDYYDIVAPTLTLAKTVPKSYQTINEQINKIKYGLFAK